jgi:hypothetical protein
LKAENENPESAAGYLYKGRKDLFRGPPAGSALADRSSKT